MIESKGPEAEVVRGSSARKNRVRAVESRLAESVGREALAPVSGLAVPRVFTRPGVDPFDEVKWERRKAVITDDQGAVIFEQSDVEVPASWSQLATNIVASKYFHGQHGTPARESSVRQLVNRVTRTLADWGREDGYFRTAEDAETFRDELVFLCLNQYGSFNSPVWFNCGLFQQYHAGKESAAGSYHADPRTGEIRRAASQYEYPQCSACFIQSVDDTMDSIMELARSEAMLFKFGSGTGTDLSSLRSSRERMSGGGQPSGPLSFLRVYDAIASVVKSGGKTRRAAKMNTLKVGHPDIREFIEAKPKEERKAWALIEKGYSGNFNGEAYGSVAFQNENLSVRVSEEFLQAVVEDREWTTHFVTDPKIPGPAYKARDLMRWIAEGAWLCGDPGVQYEDTIQKWHTCKADGAIHSSNPCSEYMFLNDSACNLASLNLMKFVRADGSFDIPRFKAAVEIFITAQEILVDSSSYPTERIARNSHLYRPLGLGYANLGSLLMEQGLPYDSDEGRAQAAAITAILHCHAYTQSARIAADRGPFERFAANRDSMLAVLDLHRKAVEGIPEVCPAALRTAAGQCAEEAVRLGREHGFRNAQVTVLAPTGTIGFMMDCDTTGVEPDIALVKYKLLAGGGLLKIVNQTVPAALRRLGYSPAQIKGILRHIDENDTIEGAPEMAEAHLAVFDCAFAPKKGRRSIPYGAHLRMMAAVQPFLSGAISKTVNMPESTTVEEIMDTYLTGWRLGLKAVAIYRDGSKRSQPLNTSSGKGDGAAVPAHPAGGNGSKAKPFRRRMPATRRSITHKFDIANHEGYLTVGLYEDNAPGELFITMAKEGSTVGGLMDCFGTAISLCLQYGVPLKTLTEKFAHTRFEPSGFTKNPDIPIAKSLTDYIFRWLTQTFVDIRDEAHPAEAEALKAAPSAAEPAPAAPAAPRRVDAQFQHFMADAPACDQCGSITVRNGACYRCYNCGNSMGCS
jgi:ribonucleoside-diphosphate reductase alpha chain